MVGGGATSSQLVSPAPAPATSPEEDEILKRNTDCVYFLASPLTCKKGSECEYRHSDVARVNPRDCYYWLNGNCLNPKCAFRHPPLDGLLGSDASTPMGPPVPAPHHAPYVTPKQGVACIFFQKGFCLKGHLCPFLHGPPNPVNNKPAHSGSANPVPNASKMVFSNPEKPIQEQKFAQQTTIQKVASFPARNGGNGAVDKKVSLPSNFREPPRYKPANVVPTSVMMEPPSSKLNRSGHHSYHVSENNIIRGKDTDEYSREPSPGFDVLVDNEREESEYYHEKDELGRSRGQDYDVDRDMYREHRDYDHYNERDGHFDADHVENLERRPYPRSDRENGSDLRHRISKQRRSNDNGVRSVVNRDYDRESQNHVDRISRRESHHHRPDQHLDQGTLSSRLRGRIKIPGSNENNRRVERDIDIERKHLSRYSPGRPISVNQSRLRERIKGPRDMVSDNDARFAGPKRLSELKSVKTEHQPNNEQSLGKRKYPKTEDDMSFEGPKPLSEILKRKRGISINNNDDHISSVNTQDNTPKERDVAPSDKEDHNSVSVDMVAETENNKPADDKSANDGPSEVENEDGLIDEDALLDEEELEAYDDQRDGEYEYEQMEGEEEDYNLDEGEYVDEEELEEYEKKENAVCS